jgi:hypothetical protein
MLKVLKSFILAGVIFLLITETAVAQVNYPRVSPGAKVSQMIGITEVTVTYHRPGVKNRLVWGDLVPFNEIWRTGANEATTIEFSHDVTFANTVIAAGNYSFFTIIDASQNAVTIIINKNPDLWGTSGYKKEEDVVRLSVKPVHSEHQEWLQFSFDDLSKNSANLVFHWENFKFPIKISVDTDKNVLAEIKDSIGWRAHLRAANYCLENKAQLEDGLQALNHSINLNKNYWNMTTKARFHAMDEEYDAAVETMKEALVLGKKMDDPPYNMKSMEALIKEWEVK